MVETNVIIKILFHIDASVLKFIRGELIDHVGLEHGDRTPYRMNIGYDHARVADSISLLGLRLVICIMRAVEAVRQ